MKDWLSDQLLNRTPTIMGESEFRHYAIFVPIIKRNREDHLLFEVRSASLRRQPGEICFPGGKVDKTDQNSKGAAIRETIEELNITPEVISTIFPLDYIVSPNQMILHLYAGFLHTPFESIKPNDDEVAEIFSVPLAYFLTNEPNCYHVNLKPEPEESFPFHLIPQGKNYPWQIRGFDELFYLYKDKVIWGLTAKIVHHFIKIINNQ
ncbi:NUDIX hydrolase [Bacillus kexueae]|uniref:NUDIX hydrolase n=1 Tax=Aeribacillus kexueae TaxID=2078952 RepID=UPI001FAFBC40|nr:CoA pyrophosphatase [Bacillus kexueae]